MSVSPGWYQDPEGPTGKARYWDGTRWAPRGQEPGTGPDPGPASGRPRWLVPLVVALAAALVVALGVWLLPPLLEAGDDSSEDPTATAPVETAPGETAPGTETSQGEPAQVGELDCAAAMSTNFDAGPEIRVAGIVMPFPVHENWGFQFDSSQWPWVNDLHAWGTLDIEPKGETWAAGVVVGRLEAGNGFGDVKQAAEAVTECLVTYGPFNTGEEMEVGVSQEVTVDGMPGWSMEMAYPEEGTYGASDIHVLTLDSGQEGNLAVVIGFNPQGHEETAAVLADLFAGITSQ